MKINPQWPTGRLTNQPLIDNQPQVRWWHSMPKTWSGVRPWSGRGLGTVRAGSRRENPSQDREELARTVTHCTSQKMVNGVKMLTLN